MSGTNIEALEPMNCAFVSKPKTDDRIFRLHYKVTTKLLMVFVALTLANTIGNSIVCYSTDRALPTDILNSYCSMQNTFIVKEALDRELGTHVAHPGVDTYVVGSDDTRIYQKYYIWVPVFLTIQAAMFFVPHYIWRHMQPTKIKWLLVSLHRPIIVVIDEGVESLCKYYYRRRDNLAIYLYISWGGHTFYAIMYNVVCVGLSLANVIGQIFFVDHVLDGEFLTYGTNFMGVWWGTLDPSNRSDPMTRIFPRMSKCTYRQYGAGGSVQNYDILCAMPFNVYYEKIFIAVWFWFILLSAITGVYFIFCMALVTMKRFRVWKMLPGKPDTNEMDEKAGNNEENNKVLDGGSGSNQEAIPLNPLSSSEQFTNENSLPSNEERVAANNLINAANGHARIANAGMATVPAADSYTATKRNLEAGNVGDWFLMKLLKLNLSGNNFDKVMVRLDRLHRAKLPKDAEILTSFLRDKNK